MPTEHVRFSYTFDELSDEANLKAIESVREMLGGAWWDSADNDDVADVMRFTFSQQVGDPASTGDVSIAGFEATGIKLESWSCNYGQGDYVGFSGSLTRENAPKLPWVDGLASVTLEDKRGHTSIWFVVDEPECICDDGFSSIREPSCDAHAPIVSPFTDEQKATMKTAVESAMSAAHQAGYKEIEYKTSEEYATDWIENNEPDFNENGTLFS